MSQEIEPSQPPQDIEPTRPDPQLLLEVSWQGPLPPPGIMRGYEEVMPGASEILFGAFKDQANHRMREESSSSFRRYVLNLLTLAISGAAMVLGFIFDYPWHGVSVFPVIWLLSRLAAFIALRSTKTAASNVRTGLRHLEVRMLRSRSIGLQKGYWANSLERGLAQPG